MNQSKEYRDTEQDLALYKVETRDFVYEPRDSDSPMTTSTSARRSTGLSSETAQPAATRATQSRSRVQPSTYYTRTHASRGQRRKPQARTSLTNLPLSFEQNGVTNLTSPSVKEWSEAKTNSGFPIVSASEASKDRIRRAYMRTIARAASPEAASAIEDEDEDEESSVSKR